MKHATTRLVGVMVLVGSATAAQLLIKSGESSAKAAAKAKAERDQHFQMRIAPLRTRQCLACHDPGESKGGFDLSRKETALLDGESDRGLVSDSSDARLLWDDVRSEEMPPHSRPRMSP